MSIVYHVMWHIMLMPECFLSKTQYIVNLSYNESMSSNLIVGGLFIIYGIIVILLPKKYHILFAKTFREGNEPFKEENFKHYLIINTGGAFIAVGLIIVLITLLLLWF